jgi:bacterial/archaeal transporter family-2 protein
VSYLLVIAAGISVALQQVLNADLRTGLGSPWWAGFISYLGGTFVFVVILIATGAPGLTEAAIARTPWPSWTGGLFGAFFIGVSAIMVPRLGAATTLVLIIGGQMLGSLIFDHVGLLSVPQHSVTPQRLLGVVLLIGAVMLVRS